MLRLKQSGTSFIYRFREYDFKPLLVLMLGSAGSNLIYFICFLILGFALSNEHFGHFRVAYAYIMIAVSISHLGVNVSLTRLFPQFTEAQKKAALILVVFISIISSLLLGCIVLLSVPSLLESKTPFDSFFYFVAFFFSICGATCSNFVLAVLQAEGKLSAYSRFQFRWRALLLGSATLGGLIGGSFWALILMPFAYIIIFSRTHEEFNYMKAICLSKVTPDWSVFSALLRGGVWPLAAIAISIFYGSAEFLYVKAEDINSGVAGSYALASLIYMGGTSFFYPFQTYAVSRVVRKEIDFNGVWKLQGVCFILVLSIGVICIIGANVLNHIFPLKFDDRFLNFSNLVALKLVLWGMYSVTGALLCYVGKEFESFLLTIVALTILFLVPHIFHLNTNIELMVKMQLLTGLIILFGSSSLFCSGYPGNKQ